jgi:uncharacterized protein (TIGR03437 family)
VLAPGSLATLRGTFVAAGPILPSQSPLPITLGGTTVRVNGVPAPLLYASASQINFQVPFEVSAGDATTLAQAGGAEFRLRLPGPRRRSPMQFFARIPHLDDKSKVMRWKTWGRIG